MKRALVVFCLGLVACSSSPEPAEETPTPQAPPSAPTPAPSPVPSPSDVAGCPNAAAVAGDASLRTGDPVSGDVDGDGSDDIVAVHFDPAGEPGCQAFVVAESASARLAAPLESWRSDLGLTEPTLNSLHEIDGDAGLEVVVNMGAGASTQFVGIVTADDGVLRQVHTDAPGPVGEGLFGFGGSVGHLEAVDCAPAGGVVSSFAVPAGKQYRVERRFLVFEGTELVEESVEVERIPPEELDRFPEYRASPFGGCN